MLNRVDDYKTEGSWVDFRLHGISPSGKTRTWVVQNRENLTILGRIEWFSRWRKYTFNPNPDMVFEVTCLRDIADFLEEIMKEHRAKAKTK
jgi:hypothetical protein